MIFFNFGFRPFFLAAGMYAVLSVGIWGLHLAVGLPFPDGAALGGLWHAHEMVYGFAAAAFAGFLLTASSNWSGRPPLAGAPLIGLSLLWLAGRGGMWLPADVMSTTIVAIVDVAFLPALLIAALPALAGAPKRQGVFIAILVLLTTGNVLYHGEALGLPEVDARRGLLLGLDGLVLLLTVVGGRVVPSFTATALRQAGLSAAPVSRVIVERGVLLSTVLVVVLDGFGQLQAMGAVALIAALLHAIRLAGWQGHRCREPVTWILHAGYSWIVLGLALRGLDGLGLFAVGDAGIHALSTGAVGTMTIAVMTRAALGHTGRPLIAPPAVVAAYVLVLMAGLARVVAGLIPLAAPLGYSLAAAAWVTGFGLFTLVYFPILTGPRADR